MRPKQSISARSEQEDGLLESPQMVQLEWNSEIL